MPEDPRHTLSVYKHVVIMPACRQAGLPTSLDIKPYWVKMRLPVSHSKRTGMYKGQS